MSKAETCLDIGCGEGGIYLESDLSNVLRVGLDINEKSLIELRRQYKRVMPVRADAASFESLPFVKEVFDRIEVWLPFGGLLYGLCASDLATWGELYRVLKKGGKVEILTESPKSKMKDFPKDMNVRAMVSVAESKGFEVGVREVEISSVRQLGTKFSRLLTNENDLARYSTRFYWVRAVKLGTESGGEPCRS